MIGIPRIGDKVRIVNSYSSFNNMTGEVVEDRGFGPDGMSYRVVFDQGGASYFNPRELGLLSPAPEPEPWVTVVSSRNDDAINDLIDRVEDLESVRRADSEYVLDVNDRLDAIEAALLQLAS